MESSFTNRNKPCRPNGLVPGERRPVPACRTRPRPRGPWLDGLGDRFATEVSVSDNGTGMPPAVTERAAEAFFTVKPHGKETGLGLRMAHRFASMYGSRVTIETMQGQGTTVCLALPHCGDTGPQSRQGSVVIPLTRTISI